MDSASKERVELARHRFKLETYIGQTVKLIRKSGGFMGLCPFHQEKTPSFHVSPLRGTFKCFGCGAQGDIFDFVMLSRGLTFPHAVSLLLGDDTATGVHRHAAFASDRSAQADDEKRRVAHAHALWLKRQPIRSTLAEVYLRRTRGLGGSFIPDILGFVPDAYCSPIARTTDALIAPLQDSAGHVTAVQQIFLSDQSLDAWRDVDGRRIKRTLGVMGDGAVRLGTPDAVLGLAGSVEDALAASALFSLPVWAVCGEMRLSRVWVPPEIELVIVFADADEAGEREARKCESSRNTAHAKVEIATPDVGKDWAEYLKGHPIDGQRRTGTVES